MEYFLIFSVITIMWVVISKFIWGKKITLLEMGVQFIISSLLAIATLAFCYFSDVGDSATINGMVTEKVRVEDDYQQSYECNCRTVTHGSGNNKYTERVCSTCWRTIYTVDWYLRSTVGNISLDSVESRSRSIWSTKDPTVFVNAVVGEPCSKKDYFENYVKAAKNSLFNTGNFGVNMTTPVPPYPSLYNTYKIKSVLNVDTKVDVSLWDTILRDKLKTLSPKKQVNIILVFVNTADAMYKYKAEKSWLGGKKNDYVIIIGTTDNKTVQWIDGFTFGLSQGNFQLLSEVNSELVNKPLDAGLTVDIIVDKVDKLYVRKGMKDFEYLKKEIQPSMSAMIFLSILQLLVNIGITIFNIRNDLKTHF